MTGEAPAGKRGGPAPESALREQVLGELRAIVESAAAGSRLPTVRKLMADVGTSQYVVQAALEQLRAEGLIVSHVGRGTFKAAEPKAVAETRSRSVLLLKYHHPYERGDRIADLVHHELTQRGHRSIVLTYSNTEQVMEVLRGGAHFDSCILQPRSSVVPIALLSLLKERCDHILVEGLALEHLDVDAASNSPEVCVELTVEHLTQRGFNEITWLTEAGENYFYRRLAGLFAAYCRDSRTLSPSSRIVHAPVSEGRLGLADFEAAIAGLKFSARHRAGIRRALVVASFTDAATILSGLERNGLEAPRDLGVLRVGTPDLYSDHAEQITTVGRTSAHAAAFVLERLDWRWRHPRAPSKTVYDVPEVVAYGSTGAEVGRSR